MALDRIEVIENRLSLLEHQLELFSYRLRSIEYWRAGRTDVPQEPHPRRKEGPTPPPFVRPTPGVQEPGPDNRPPVNIPPRWQTPPPPPAPPKPAPRGDAEYMIGAKVLPKIGAFLVLLGLLSLVAWGYSSGWITPAMIFTGEVLFCLAFVAVGQKKRGEAEQFGQILTGIGSCGLYFTLAGGHLVQHLYPGSVLVAAAMTLSFANLIYGTWANSRAFLGIGIIGGFATALLPMKESNTDVYALLHVMVALPAALIAAKKRWWDMAAWLWLASVAAAGPLLASDATWVLQVGVLFASALAAIAAYAYGARSNSFDPEGWVAPTMLFLTAALSLAVQHHPTGALSILAVAGAAGLISLLSEDPRARARLQAAAVAIPMVLGPVCFSQQVCIGMYTGLAILSALFAIGSKKSVAAGLAATELVLALLSYLIVIGERTLPVVSESILLGGLMVAAVVTALATIRTGAHRQASSLTGMALLLPLFARFAVVAFGGSALAPKPEIAVAEALALFTIGSIAFAARSRWLAAIVASWLCLAVSLFGYVVAAALGIPGGHDLALLTMLLMAAITALPVAVGQIQSGKSVVAGATGVLVGLLTIRLSFVIATMLLPGFDRFLLMSVVACGYSTLASLVGLARKSRAAVVVAWIMFALSGGFYLVDGSHLPSLGSEMAMISAMFCAFLAATVATAPQAKRHPEIWHVVAPLGWVVFSRWVDVSLSWSSTSLHSISTLTVAWIVYALSLMSIGFWLRLRELRYWSFAVMFASVLKILAIDMASTHIMFRVAVLVGLGLLMLAGGYWYIKGKGEPAASV